MSARRFVFAGPTLHRGLAAGLEMHLEDWVLLPPARRGDVQRLVDTVAPAGTIAVVDGYFHLTQLAVGHAELRAAIERGWQVWGLSSMGAIRAGEMHTLGMRGAGQVFARYRDDPHFRDDEVTLLHEPSVPYRAFSEPLVHVRHGLDVLVAEGELAAADRDAIIGELEAMWFGDRTLAWVGERVARVVERARVTAWLARFDDFQLKSHDLAAFLAAAAEAR